jgi:uncharacterized protein YecE (DUF72 family)
VSRHRSGARALARALLPAYARSMQLHVGTSGFAYKEWKGSFYPEDCRPDDLLRFYASRLAAVEINNTFYRMPSARILAQWATQVPEGFAFALKTPMRITHRSRLREVEGDLEYFLRTAGTLGDKLGPILVQLPPNLRKDLPRLVGFLALVPPGVRAAVEFRHPSWLDDDVYAALRERDAALVLAEADPNEPSPAPPDVATASWGYLRLRRAGYDDDALATWVARVRRQPWQQAFAFFKHEEAGAGPRLARRFEEIWNAAGASATPRRAPARTPRRDVSAEPARKRSRSTI